MTIHTFANILPLQDHYYLLHNGSRYARHGTEEANGLLIFQNLERAEQFFMTVGVGLPEFQPVKISTDDVFELAVEAGAICIAQGETVIVASLSKPPSMVLKDGPPFFKGVQR